MRLAENYDVFISKAQLDSILVNYTRSGSLLFRKLVCILILFNNPVHISLIANTSGCDDKKRPDFIRTSVCLGVRLL